MPKKPAKAIIPMPRTIDNKYFLSQIAAIIKKRKKLASARISSKTAMICWETEHFINTTILCDNQAECGKRIFPTLSAKLLWSHFCRFDVH